MNNKDFVNKLKEIFKDENYSFIKTKFFKYHLNVIITCPIHGDFLVEPANALYHHSGCPYCVGKKISKKKTLTTEEFIRRAKRKHGNWYDYSLVDYKDSQTKVKIICPAHGVFEQTPNNHLKGCGCPECAKLKFSSN